MNKGIYGASTETLRVLIFLLLFTGWFTHCGKAGDEIVGSHTQKEEASTDETSLSIQCRYDTTFVRSLVKQFQVRFGEASSVMETDLDFYDSYDRSVFPDAKVFPHQLYDTLYMPVGFTSVELRVTLEDGLRVHKVDIINQSYNTRETLRRSYKDTYKIEGNSITAHVSYPDLRRARNHQRTLYLNFSDDTCEYDVPIILKLTE